MENQRISEDLANSNRVVGPQTGPVAANIFAKHSSKQGDATKVSDTLISLDTEVHAKERIDSMEKQGQPATSSSSNTSEKSTEKSAENAATTAASAPY